MDLAEIAHHLDQQERIQLQSSGVAPNELHKYQEVSYILGFWCLIFTRMARATWMTLVSSPFRLELQPHARSRAQVIETALAGWGLELVPWNRPDVQYARQDPR